MRSRWIAVGLGLAGAGLVLLAASRNWYVISLPGLPGTVGSSRTGSDVNPELPALAAAAAAGAVVLGTAGRLVRPVAAALLVLAGAGIVVAVLSTDGVAVVLTTEVRTQGAWRSLVLVGAALVLVAGLVGLARFRSWPAPTRRYERGRPVTTPGAGAAAPVDDWTSLSRGDDPT